MDDHLQSILNDVKIEAFTLEEDGNFPNNNRLPVLLYRKAMNPSGNLAMQFESILNGNGWGGSWRNGIFAYHHYHSTAHEVLAVYSGSVRVQLGGPNGKKVDLGVGDIVILPAGTAHKRLSSSGDFGVIGAYPHGQENYDMNYGRDGERPETDRNIEKVALPDKDPIYGEEGPLTRYWE